MVASDPGGTGRRTEATFSLRRRLWRTRGITLYLALVVLTPVLLVTATRLLVKSLDRPNSGLFLSAYLRVETVDDRWPGVRIGDRVVAINGRAVTDSELFKHDLEPGVLTVLLERDGVRFEQTAHTSEWDSAYVVAVWARVVGGAWLFVIGLVAFLTRPGEEVTWTFLLFCYCLGVLVLLGWLFESGTSMHYTMYALIPLVSSLGVHLYSRFPEPVSWVERRRWLLALCYLPGVVLPLVVFRQMSRPEDIEGAFAETVCWLWSLLAISIMLAIVVVRWRRAVRDGDRRLASQSRVLVLGAVIGIAAPQALLVAMDVLGALSNERWMFEAAVACIVVYAFHTAYAIGRQNILEIDRFTGALVGHSLTVAGLIGVYVVLLIGLTLATRDSAPAVQTVVIAAVAVSAVPAFRLAKQRVDRWFARERADTHGALARLHRVLSAEDADRAQCVRAAIEAASIVQSDRVELWSLSPDTAEYQREGEAKPAAEDAPHSVARDSPLVHALRGVGTGGVEDLSATPFPADAQEVMWALGLAVAAPIRAHGDLIGFLGIGRKLSGTAHAHEDLAFLSAVGAHVGSALERLQRDRSRYGRYRIERRLGVGGMAEVFLAWQTGPGGFERKVALKTPLPDVAKNPNVVSMLVDEARVAAQLRHRHVAQLYEVDEQDGVPFVAMEYIDGPSLRELIATSQTAGLEVPVRVAVALMSAVLDALHHAHCLCDPDGEPLGLIHRDVTPSNVLLSQAGVVKLVDFGIARAATQHHRTQTGVVRGTVPYMSPEQASGGALDRGTDIYSAGVVLYELLTLRRLFPRGPVPIMPPPPSSVRAGLRPALDEAIVCAIWPERARRFSTAAEFRDDLERALLPEVPASEAEIAAWMAWVGDAEIPPEQVTETLDENPADGDAPTHSTKRVT